MKTVKNRMTKARKALLEVLENNHFTFSELKKELAKKGFTNVSTLYNNISYFLDNNMIIEFSIDGKTYYDIGVDNPFHKHHSHIHLVVKKPHSKPHIDEIDYPEVYELIKNHPDFKNLKIEYIRILVSATVKN